MSFCRCLRINYKSKGSSSANYQFTSHLLTRIISSHSNQSPLINMMKLFVLIAFFGLAAAQFRNAPRLGNPQDVQILRQESENDGQGTYSYSYETSDGTSAAQKGFLKPAVGTAEPAQEVSGFYTYVSPDGTPVRVDYIANEFGFQPTGDALPTSPPIPEAILRSLQANGQLPLLQSRGPAPAQARPRG